MNMIFFFFLFKSSVWLQILTMHCCWSRKTEYTAVGSCLQVIISQSVQVLTETTSAQASDLSAGSLRSSKGLILQSDPQPRPFDSVQK